MGQAISEAAERRHSFQIERQNAIDNEHNLQVRKLLIVGAADSGKNEFLKQIVDNYGVNLSDKQLREYVPIIHGNIITMMQSLLRHCTEEKAELTVGAAREKSFVLGLNPDAVLDEEIADAIAKLWKDLQTAVTQERSVRIPSSAEYFFSRVHEIAKVGWIPNKEDVEQSKRVTGGVVEEIISIDFFRMNIIDIGGQRNERKKWIRSFEDVTAVIFVASLNDYDQELCFDDSTTGNKLIDALNHFEEVCSSRWFSDCSMILFLLGKDLFEDKIKRVPLTVCFPEYSLPNDFENGCKYIARKFEARNLDPRMHVHVHVSNATDQSNLSLLFESIRDIIQLRGMRMANLV